MNPETRMMRNKLVAIIDDDVLFAERLAALLGGLGLQTVIVGGGLELISVLSIDRPHFLLIDTMLNWINPYELIDSIRKNSELRDIKVFLMTQQKDFERTCDRYPDILCIYKPSESSLLVEKLREEIVKNESA